MKWPRDADSHVTVEIGEYANADLLIQTRREVYHRNIGFGEDWTVHDSSVNS
jgi:hypothetical protein